MAPIGPEILGQLLRETAPALELYARQWCANAEDVVQEALIELATQDPAPANIRAWLFRAVRNRAFSAVRSAQRRRHHEQQAATTREPWFESSGGDQLDAQTVTAALATLSVEEREPIVAHLWGGLSFAEIATLMGCSTTSAHRRFQSGLERLRERLVPACPKTPASSE